MIKDIIKYEDKEYQLSTVYIEDMVTFETMIFPIENGIVSGEEVYKFRTLNSGKSKDKHGDIYNHPEKYLTQEAIDKYLKSKEDEIEVPIIKEIINEDGSKMNYFPKNPLQEKWDKLYPPTRNGKPCSPYVGKFEDGGPMMNYTCVICYEEKCRHSNNWKVPEEDREVYEKYLKQVEEHNKIHNPTLYKLSKGEITLEQFMED